MSTPALNQWDCFNIDLSDAFFSEYSCIETGVPSLRGLTGPFQAAPGAVSYAPNENAAGPYEIRTSEPDWPVKYPSATDTDTPKHHTTDTQITGASFLPAFDSPNAMQHHWQTPTLQHPLVSKDTALTGMADNFTLYSSKTPALPGSLLAREPKARSLRNGFSGSSQSTISRGLFRHTPYSVSSDRTRRSDSPTPAYQCQWLDGTRPCGTQVLASRHAIVQHLHTVHAIQLKADKTSQVCHWARCQKSMRKESIARHILEVHMQDKVSCPSCGSAFARTDSMQRHQRTQCHGNRDASGTHKASK